MADLRLDTKYRLELTKDEWMLVHRGLRGVLTDEEKPLALALQETLILQRATALDQMAAEAAKTVDNISRARNDAQLPLPLPAHVRRMSKRDDS